MEECASPQLDYKSTTVGMLATPGLVPGLGQAQHLENVELAGLSAPSMVVL